MASVLMDDRTVTVALSVTEKIEALRGDLAVPRTAVVRARAVPDGLTEVHGPDMPTEWLAVRCRSGEPVNGLHHVIVGWDTYDERVFRGWLEARVRAVEAATWDGIASQLRLLGAWEFESYHA